MSRAETAELEAPVREASRAQRPAAGHKEGTPEVPAAERVAEVEGRAAETRQAEHRVEAQQAPEQPTAKRRETAAAVPLERTEPVEQPEESRPVASRPAASRPVASRPVASRPVASQPEVFRREVPQPAVLLRA